MIIGESWCVEDWQGLRAGGLHTSPSRATQILQDIQARLILTDNDNLLLLMNYEPVDVHKHR